MQRRTLALLVLAFGGTSLFLLGIVAAPLLGLIPPRAIAGHPAATISLDLSGQVDALHDETARLKTALAQSARDVSALEAQFAQSAAQSAAQAPPPAPPAAARDDPAARQRIADLESEVAQAQVQLAELRTAQAAAQRALTRRDESIAALRRDRAAAAESAAAAELAQKTAERAAEAARSEAGNAASAAVDRLRAALAERDAENAALRMRLATTEAAVGSVSANAESPAPSAPVAAPEQPVEPATEEGAGGAGAGATSVADGVTAYQAGDYTRAYDIWRPLAEAGDPQAQFHVGALYYEGRGVGRDFAAARRWLDRAVAKGSIPAAALIADLDGAEAR